MSQHACTRDAYGLVFTAEEHGEERDVLHCSTTTGVPVSVVDVPQCRSEQPLIGRRFTQSETKPEPHPISASWRLSHGIEGNWPSFVLLLSALVATSIS